MCGHARNVNKQRRLGGGLTIVEVRKKNVFRSDRKVKISQYIKKIPFLNYVKFISIGWGEYHPIQERGALFHKFCIQSNGKNLLNRKGGVKGMIPAVIELITFFLLCLSVSIQVKFSY